MGLAGLEPPELARLFALGANDARTPLATLTGYARTLSRELSAGDAAEYAATIEESAGELEDIVERLALVARIQEGRYTPSLVEVETADLARAAIQALGAERVELSGQGARARVDRSPAEDALTACARATMRHGAIDRVTIELDGRSVSYGPVMENARPVLGGGEMREFGVGSALLVLRALGCQLSVEGDRFVVVLPE
ncbi:MAG: histidine kinase dimerization/phospho-acceptor domain-containing protein [Gaiellaceae bacterium]